MLLTSDVRVHMQEHFKDIKFYNGTINKDTKCVGIYLRSGSGNIMPIGGPANGSYQQMPISLLVHWDENTDNCQKTANEIYGYLYGLTNVEMNNKNIISVQLLDSGPIDLSRDEKNRCEMVIRANILYNK